MIKNEETQPIKIVFVGARGSGVSSLVQKIVNPNARPLKENEDVSQDAREIELIKKKPMTFGEEVDIDDNEENKIEPNKQDDKKVIRPYKKLKVTCQDISGIEEVKADEIIKKADIVVYCIDFQQGSELINEGKYSDDIKKIKESVNNVIVAWTKADDISMGPSVESALQDGLNDSGFACTVKNNNITRLYREIRDQAFDLAKKKNLQHTSVDKTDSIYMDAKKEFNATLDKLNITTEDKKTIEQSLKVMEEKLTMKHTMPVTEEKVKEVLSDFLRGCNKVKLRDKPYNVFRKAVITLTSAFMVCLLAATLGIAMSTAFAPYIGIIVGGVIAAAGLSIVAGIGIHHFFKPQRVIKDFVESIKNTETVSGMTQPHRLVS